jgi:hypothetical protein
MMRSGDAPEARARSRAGLVASEPVFRDVAAFRRFATAYLHRRFRSNGREVKSVPHRERAAPRAETIESADTN